MAKKESSIMTQGENTEVTFHRTGDNSAIAVVSKDGHKHEIEIFVFTQEQAKRVERIRDEVAKQLYFQTYGVAL